MIATVVIVIDPFFQYHKPLEGINYKIDNQLEQNPGMARNFDYDSVILGSSMTVNFNPLLFESLMGLNTLKLSSNAAYPKDIDNILREVTESDNEVKYVFLGLDIGNYEAEPGITAYPQPSHLYDKNLLNDVKYLFNLDMIVTYIVEERTESTPLNELYYSWPYAVYSKDVALSTFSRPQSFAEPVPTDAGQENVAQNLENYIIPYIESMPDTEFVIFFPPYSILYWYGQMGNGTAEKQLQSEQQIVETLLSYPNVRIFYFQNQYEYITNLDNYSDYTHYNKDMNDYMTECFGNGENELTSENYKTVFEEMNEFVITYDYNNI